MINEFHGLTGLRFNAKGAPVVVLITGDTWLVNFDIPIVKNPYLDVESAAALVIIAVICFSGAYVSLRYLQRYVK